MGDSWDEDTNPWTEHGQGLRYENPWFAVYDHDVTHPGGARSMYGVIRMRKRAVGVLPIDADGVVHLVGQWRFPLGRYSWEMPEGGAEPGEELEECARRELSEETGLSAGRLDLMLDLDMSNSVTDERAFIYLATDLEPGIAHSEEVEVLRRCAAPFKEVMERALNGGIRDAMTVAALLAAHHMAVTGRMAPGLAAAILK
jgi:8-oxo-dGTP pyrophosphatase MutT (NUDIX family)